MIETPTRARWTQRAVYLGFGLAATTTAILPYDLSAGGLPWPDLLFCVTMALVVRRPASAPVWAIFAVFFLRDILTMAPLGLTTLLVVLASEVVRANVQAFREYPFALEWLWMTGLFAAVTLGESLLLALTLAEPAALSGQLVLVLFTALAYPLVVAVLRFGFGLDRPKPGEFDGLGQRL